MDSLSSVLSTTFISNTICALFVNSTFFRPFRLFVPLFSTISAPWYSPQRFTASAANASSGSPCLRASSTSR